MRAVLSSFLCEYSRSTGLTDTLISAIIAWYWQAPQDAFIFLHVHCLLFAVCLRQRALPEARTIRFFTDAPFGSADAFAQYKRDGLRCLKCAEICTVRPG